MGVPSLIWARLTVLLCVHVTYGRSGSGNHLSGRFRDFDEGVMDHLEIGLCHNVVR